MSSTSVFFSANPVTIPAVIDAPPVTSPEAQGDGQASFARIMGATADSTDDASPSSPTRATEGKSEKDEKRKDDKAQTQQMTAQIVAALVTPQPPPPELTLPTGTPTDGSGAADNAPVSAASAQASVLVTPDVLGQVIILNDKAAGTGARNVTDMKQSSDQFSADDLKTRSMAEKGSIKDTESNAINIQLPSTVSLSSPNTEPTSVENAAQSAVAAAAGTAIAKQVGRVKMQDKTENNSEVAEKNLPPTSFVVQAGSTSDSTKPRTSFANLSQREGRNSTPADTSTPILAGLVQGKAQPLGNNTGTDAVRSPQADKVFTEISERVMSFKRMGADSAEVNLRPDSNTEITLSLSLRNGQVEMTARLERGNLSALNSHWPGLQQSLSQQGVRVGPLTSPQSAMNDQFSSGTSQQGAGENTSHSFERGNEGLDDLSTASPITGLANGRPQKAVVATARGWEMWA